MADGEFVDRRDSSNILDKLDEILDNQGGAREAIGLLREEIATIKVQIGELFGDGAKPGRMRDLENRVDVLEKHHDMRESAKVTRADIMKIVSALLGLLGIKWLSHLWTGK
jgi:hypothetical protein